jgi:hypothetical protein
MNSQAEFNWLSIADEHHERHFSPVKATANIWWLRQLEQEATRHGTGIILTGQSGNATFSMGRVNALQPLRADGSWDPAPRMRRMKAALRRGGHRTPPQAVKPGIPVEMPSHILDLDPWTRWCLAEPPASAAGPWTGADVTWIDPLGSPEVITAAMSIPKVAWGEKAGDRLLARQVGRGLIPEAVRLNRVRGVQGADMPGIMLRHADAYVAAVDRVRNSESAREFLDVRVLSRGAELLRGDLESARTFRQHYLRPLTAGLFAAWWDDHAPK